MLRSIRNVTTSTKVLTRTIVLTSAQFLCSGRSGEARPGIAAPATTNNQARAKVHRQQPRRNRRAALWECGSLLPPVARRGLPRRSNPRRAVKWKASASLRRCACSKQQSRTNFPRAIPTVFPLAPPPPNTPTPRRSIPRRGVHRAGPLLLQTTRSAAVPSAHGFRSCLLRGITSRSILRRTPLPAFSPHWTCITKSALWLLARFAGTSRTRMFMFAPLPLIVTTRPAPSDFTDSTYCPAFRFWLPHFTS